MAIWDAVLTASDREVLAVTGHGARQGFGERPAVLVVDVTYNFTGDQRESTVDAARRSRNACGTPAWMAVDAMRTVLAAARAARAPVFYTIGEPRTSAADVGRWGGKSTRAAAEDATGAWDRGNVVVEPIAPQAGDVVLRKAKPSAFFGTPLLSYLIELGIDTLLVMGGVTSGCIRATVVDAFSNNYRVGLVVDGTFDRYEASHRVNVFDMHAKYADVISGDEAVAYLEGTPARSDRVAR